MDLNKKRLDNITVIFLTIAIIYAIGNFIWWIINTPVIPLQFGALYFYDIFRDGWLFFNAPLKTLIMRCMFYLFGEKYYDLLIIFVNYIFFLIPLYFIYKIGVELKDKETGKIAMILFALVPAVYGTSRLYGHNNYPMMAGMTFNIYCLIKTDYFRDRKWSIWYGISIGFGLLIKDIFLWYFCAPFIYIAIIGLIEKANKAKIINIFLPIAIASLIAGWHYFRYEIIIKKVMYDVFRDSVPLFAFDSLRVTTIGLWEELLSPPIFIVFITGLMFLIFKYKLKHKNLLLLLWIIVPWFGITIMPHFKLSVYQLGFVPAIILICAEFISYIKIKYIKKIILILLIIIGFLQYIDYSFLGIKLFNLSLQYKNYEIKYFNYNLYIERRLKCFKLATYLKNKYPHSRFYVVNVPDIDSYVLVTQILLKDMHADQGRFIDDKVFLSDIIIFVGHIYTVEEIFEIDKYDRINDPVDKKVFKQKFEDGSYYRELFDICQSVHKNYQLIDIFYLDEPKTEDSRVTLLGRKDKFPRFLKNKIISNKNEDNKEIQ